jgi:hypothetical protein
MEQCLFVVSLIAMSVGFGILIRDVWGGFKTVRHGYPMMSGKG